MKKKILSLCLVVAMVATAVVGASMAYLTDTEEAVNVMTLGNVAITQNEQQRVEKDGEFTSELEDFEDGKVLMPVTYPGNRTTDTVKIGDYTIELSDKEANYVDKIISVTNDGKSDAYVRTLVAVPTGGAAWEPTPVDSNNCWLHWNIPAGYGDFWTLVSSNVPMIEIDGENYYVWEFIHKTALEPGKTTYPSVRGFYMDKRVDNDDNGYFITYDDGTTKRIEDIAVGDTVNVLVLSQAVQADGFSDATTALDTAFGDVTAEKAEAWFSGMEIPVVVNTVEAAFAALENGGSIVAESGVEYILESTDPITFDAHDATATLNGEGPSTGVYGYLGFVPAAGQDVTLSNLNVTGTGFVEVGHYGQGGGIYTVDNLVVENLASTLKNNDKGNSLACGFCHYGTATLNNCVMTGTTAVQEGAIAVDAGFVNDTTTTINGGEYGTIYCWSHSVVTIKDAEVDYIYAAPVRGTLTIAGGTHVGTIDIVSTTSLNLNNLIIEDGATVDQIIYEGTTYTYDEWMTR